MEASSLGVRSAACSTTFRLTAFSPAAYGPHRPEYLPLKQQVLGECLRRRAATPYARGETPYAYRPTGAVSDYPAGTPPTFRYPHGEWWR